MTKLEANELFDGWRSWFEDCVKVEIARYNEFQIIGHGISIPMIGIDPDFYQRREHDVRSLLANLRKACKKFGISLSIDDEPDRIELICRAYQFELEQVLRQTVKDKRRLKPRHKVRHRLSKNIAAPIVYILEKFKGDRVKLAIVKNYFDPRGSHKTSMSRQLKLISRALLKRHQKTFGSDQNYKFKMPPSILGLSVSRSDDSTMWANNWKHDLLRAISTPSDSKILRRISTREVATRKSEILKTGDNAIKRFKSKTSY